LRKVRPWKQVRQLELGERQAPKVASQERQAEEALAHEKPSLLALVSQGLTILKLE